MYVEVPSLCLEGNVLAVRESLTASLTLSFVENVTPGASREVEVSHILAKSCGLNGELQSASQHNIVLLGICSVHVIWELEEERLIEGTPIPMECFHLGSVVSDELVLSIHRHPDDIQVGHGTLVDIISEYIRFLRTTIPAIMVS